jgi:hypothetical protein
MYKSCLLITLQRKWIHVKKVSYHWQYMAWSIWGGIGFISVPSSCSILYLLAETKFCQERNYEIKDLMKFAVGTWSYKLNRSS